MLIAIATCLCLSVIVSAHPGRTDSNGGHFDHGSGGYHYHHGYSAHQHSDMDGDGNLDCPYSFDDKTGSSGNKAESPSNDTESAQGDTKKKIKNYFLPIIGCFVLYGVVLLIGEIKWRLKK
jgi:hypothetical protein